MGDSKALRILPSCRRRWSRGAKQERKDYRPPRDHTLIKGFCGCRTQILKESAMSRCPEPTGKSRGIFNAVWTALRALGKGNELEFESTGDTASTAEADCASKGNLRGSKYIRIRTLGKKPPAAYIYPCCWGYSQNHSGTRIGHYWPRLETELRLVGEPEDDQTTPDRNRKHASKPAESVRSEGTSPGRVGVLDTLHSLPEIRQIPNDRDPGLVGIKERTLVTGRKLPMNTEISGRIVELVRDFEIYTGEEMPFGDWAWSIHRETVILRKQFSSVENAIHSYDFIVKHVGHTLVAWGMDGREAKLVPPAEFHSRIKECGPRLSSWEPYSTSDLITESLARDLLDTFKTLGLSKTSSQVVTASKVMHHLLPNLVPPIDREYTSRFFTPRGLKNVREPNSTTQFLAIAQGLGWIAKSLEEQYGKGYLTSLVDRTEYATSESKIIDNAIVGYVKRHNLKKVSK